MTGATLHVELLDSIGRAITHGELEPGHALTLEQLQTEYGASRTVARECMRILESAGMVTARRRFGIVVQPSSSWNSYDRNIIRWRLAGEERQEQLRYLTELRLAVEPVAAALAAVRASVEERDELRFHAAQLHGFEAAGMADRYQEADVAFHSVLLKATRNYMYAELVDPISEAIAARPLQDFYEKFPDRGAVDLHVQTMEAVCDGDAEKAERSMREILRDVRDGLTAIAPGDEPNPGA